ncbi:1-acyl-sn-glycerol-3-phosphate acyltransferases [Jatrophihabitans endophyticus]|uniref:1-acyl-sn-glycerol-3-phosphate acyltransferases n=1 Tax=Jatrophihabitans endophyticus TaxID=1206085 RepID=A0A1M5HIH2_9ACTN|nr:lysophospholipid acyltransferase family protein [Jatrophihabitans endophyticus]SHG15688.1 1-acyl-sn-glycerol-3-phosphate acyltransferases [Jatrophihabitans endophyticus]
MITSVRARLRGRDRTYRVVIGIFRGVFGLLGLRFELRGVEHLPAAGPAVLACNHLSYLDFTFVGLVASGRARLVRFMAKQSTFENPVSGPLMRRMRHIPVDRDSGAAAYRVAARRLAAGELVGVFPEATISRSFTLKSFKLGAATLATWEQVPLVPVVLWAPQRTFTVDGRRSLRRGKTIRVFVGAPLHPARDADRAAVDAELRRRMQGLLDDAMAGYPDVPRDADDHWWLPGAHGGTAPTLADAAVAEAAARERSRARRDARRARRR